MVAYALDKPTSRASRIDPVPVSKTLKRMELVERLTDADLVNSVVDKVWGKLVMNSDADLLLNELMNRFERLTRIRRNDAGKVVAGGAGVS